MTYSIVARDPENGSLGIAVQSHFFGVGRIVPWAEPGVGAVATQAFAEASYGPLGMELMRAGTVGARGAGTTRGGRSRRGLRQIAMVDAAGRRRPHWPALRGGRR